MAPTQITPKLWNGCKVLRNKGLWDIDYAEEFDPGVAGLFLKRLARSAAAGSL